MPISVDFNDRNSERGSMLLLVCVILVFAGFVFSLGIGSFATQDQQDKIELTAKKQQFLINQLSAYAQRENKIPCPADPSVNPTTAAYGFARGATPTTDPNGAGTCAGANTDGIIPFRTLGLSDYDSVDGWGRLMTFRISPVMNNPVAGISLTTANIFMRCRRFPWYDDGYKVYTPPAAYYNTTNVYPEKAVFCCPPSNSTFDQTTDLKIYASSADLAATLTINDIKRTTVDYGLISTTRNYDVIPPADGTQEIFAFAIISHGANGAGAYSPGTAARTPSSTSADEAVNSGTDQTTVIDHPMIMAPGINHFDDMVVWRTQLGIMSQLNNGTCFQPWR